MKCDKINLVLISALALAGCNHDKDKPVVPVVPVVPVEVTGPTTVVEIEIVPEIEVTPEVQIVYAFEINWTAPMERDVAEGEPAVAMSLSEIKGYKIYWGLADNDYPNAIEVFDHTATNYYNDTGWEAKEYFIVLTCLDTVDRESVYSEQTIIDFTGTGITQYE